MASRADALAALVQTACGSDVAVVIGADPDKLDGASYPEFVCIIPMAAPYDANLLLNAVAQESMWEWSLFVGTGSGGQQEDALDRTDVLLELLVSGLIGERLDTSCGEMQLRERHAFHGWRPGDAGVVYRQDWAHHAFAQWAS